MHEAVEAYDLSPFFWTAIWLWNASVKFIPIANYSFSGKSFVCLSNIFNCWNLKQRINLPKFGGDRGFEPLSGATPIATNRANTVLQDERMFCQTTDSGGTKKIQYSNFNRKLLTLKIAEKYIGLRSWSFDVCFMTSERVLRSVTLGH